MSETLSMNARAVQKRLGFSHTTMYKLLKEDPTFPRGRRVGVGPKARRLWDAAEIDAWWQSLPRS